MGKSGIFRPCTWNGIEYPSMAHAARALRITKETMRLRLNKGYTCDDDLPARSKKQASPLTDSEKTIIKRYLSSHVQTMDVRQIAKRFGVSVKEVYVLLDSTED